MLFSWFHVVLDTVTESLLNSLPIALAARAEAGDHNGVELIIHRFYLLSIEMNTYVWEYKEPCRPHRQESCCAKDFFVPSCNQQNIR